MNWIIKTILLLGSMQIYTANTPIEWQFVVRILPLILSIFILLAKFSTNWRFFFKINFNKIDLVFVFVFYAIARNSLFSNNLFEWTAMNSKLLSVIPAFVLCKILKINYNFLLSFSVVYVLIYLTIQPFQELLPEWVIIFDNVKGHRIKFDILPIIILGGWLFNTKSKFISSLYFVSFVLFLKQWAYSVYYFISNILFRNRNLRIIKSFFKIIIFSFFFGVILFKLSFISFENTNTLGTRLNSIVILSNSGYDFENFIFGRGMIHSSMKNNFQEQFGNSFWPNDLGLLGVFFQLGLTGLILYIIITIRYFFRGLKQRNFTLIWMSISLISSPWLLVFPGMYYLIYKLYNEYNSF